MPSSYQRPHRLDDALEYLAQGNRVIVAGGTDYFPARVGAPLDDDVLDVTAIDSLRGISQTDSGYRIGAATTWTDLIRADLPAMFDGYKLAAREVGGVQIQNAGTLAGNLCNASPAADGTPALLTLNAEIELRSRRGVRTVPVADFVTGNRITVRAADELVTAILIPPTIEQTHSHFLKLGARKYLVISIAMVAGVVSLGSDGKISDARLACGSCSLTPQRLYAAEAALIGAAPDAVLATRLDHDMIRILEPIDDIRASADYRLDAAFTLLTRLVTSLAAGFAETSRGNLSA